MPQENRSATSTSKASASSCVSISMFLWTLPATLRMTAVSGRVADSALSPRP